MTPKYDFFRVGTARRPYVQAPNVRVVEVPFYPGPSGGDVRGTILVEQEALEELRSGPITVNLSEEPYVLPDHLMAIAPEALERAHESEDGSHRYLFNGRKIGMAGEIMPMEEEPWTLEVDLRPTTYFDGLCSNELAPYLIQDRKSGFQFDVFADDVCIQMKPGSSHRHIRRFDSSRLSNHIGVSTIARTIDDHLILPVQSHLSLQSPKLIAPSASGSIDVSDYEPGDSLQRLVTRAIERNLQEEIGIPSSIILGTEIVGFGRWLERGAKPEFFAVTHLQITAAQFERRRPVVDVITVRPERLPLFAWNDEEKDMREFGSVPLMVGLELAALELGIENG